jgi:cation transport regulator ChaC
MAPRDGRKHLGKQPKCQGTVLAPRGVGTHVKNLAKKKLGAMQKKRIAILAWGSLLWEDNPQFHKHHHGWRKGGPVLKIEFSQIASPAEDGLALVIDGKHGAECRVAYTHSRRAHVEDAICDLQSREETTRSNIGYILFERNECQGRDSDAVEKVRAWALRRRLRAVIWTDTPSNFEQSQQRPFSVSAALTYIRSQSPRTKSKIAEYVWRSPEFVDTPLRRALQKSPWFSNR